MKPARPHHQEGHAELLAEVESRQRNIVWPDTMRNSRGMDELLWKGSLTATKVQRVGIAVWGLLFLSLGLFFMFVLGPEQHSIMEVVFGLLLVALGTKISLNAFMRKPKPQGRRDGHLSGKL